MHPDHPLDLLGGLTPSKFMREYWQRKPYKLRYYYQWHKYKPWWFNFSRNSY